jgi:hypothetical protein
MEVIFNRLKFVKRMEIKCKEELKKLFQQTQNIGTEKLLCGLTILVKDAADFINATALQNDATEVFRYAYLDMMNHDRYYWSLFGPDLYMELSDAQMPSGMARNAAICKFNLDELRESKIIQEWTRAPGWHFFKLHTQQIKNNILGKLTLEKLKASLCEPEDPTEAYLELVERLANPGQLGSCFWYPLMLYLVILLKETDFITLQENN